MLKNILAAFALAALAVMAGYGLTKVSDVDQRMAPVYEVVNAVATFDDCGNLYMLTLVFEDGSVKWFGGETSVTGGLTIEEAMEIAQRLPSANRYATIFPCEETHSMEFAL